MPITDSFRKRLSEVQRKRLAGVISEIRARNLPIPPDLRLDAPMNWPLDENGFLIKNNGTKYQISDDQVEVGKFVTSKARFAALISGRGGGKSAAGAQKALKKIREGQSGAVINPDFENFKISTWPEFREWIPWDMVVPSHRYMRGIQWQPHQPFRLAFTNGAVVYCKGLKDEDSARGPNINWFWYDEAGRDLTGGAWTIAVPSVRIGKDPQIWITTTPRGRSHWIYKFFVKKDIPQDAIDLFAEIYGEDSGIPFIEVFSTNIYNNRSNLDPGYMAAILAAYPVGWLRDQEVYGKFVDEGGNLGDRSWFNGKIIDSIPEDVKVGKRLRYWDMGATEKKISGKKKNDPDETVGTLMSWNRRKDIETKKDIDDFYIEHQVGKYVEWDDLLELILQTAIADGVAVKIIIEEEPGSGGKNQVAAVHNHIRANFPTHPGVEGYRPEGDRVMLANVWFADAKEGNVYLVNGNWVLPMFDQLDDFPEGNHDDRITSISGARINIAPVRTWRNIDFLHL